MHACAGAGGHKGAEGASISAQQGDVVMHGVQWFINTNTTHGQEHRAPTSEASSSKA